MVVYAAMTKSDESADAFNCMPPTDFTSMASQSPAIHVVTSKVHWTKGVKHVCEAHLSRNLKFECLDFTTIAINTFANATSCTPKRQSLWASPAKSAFQKQSSIQSQRCSTFPEPYLPLWQLHELWPHFKKSRHDIANELIHLPIDRE